jgi:hypothetical protein
VTVVPPAPDLGRYLAIDISRSIPTTSEEYHHPQPSCHLLFAARQERHRQLFHSFTRAPSCNCSHLDNKSCHPNRASLRYLGSRPISSPSRTVIQRTPAPAPRTHSPTLYRTMAHNLCGPSNALQNFQKHSTVDRTLQQDRFVSRQSPSQVRPLPDHPHDVFSI